MRIALGIEYDGSNFAGWQVQDGLVTVQASVESALSKVADHPVRVVCAGRTDAGVHATAQVIHFDTSAQREMRAWVFGANANLSHRAGVLWARPMDGDFHARFSALRRRYRYVIFNRPIRPALLASKVSWFYRPLNTTQMREAAAYLLGEHDFSAYRAQSCQAKSAIRTIYDLRVWRCKDLVLIDVEANAFLHHMVRNIAGVLSDVGMGKRDPAWAREVLESCDRSIGGVTAPPQGLYLTGVCYPPRYAIPALSPFPLVW